MKETMLRQLIGVLFAVGYLMSVLDWSIFAAPVLLLTTNAAAPLYAILITLFYKLFMLWWIHMQRDSVIGGEHARYMNTLPISTKSQQAVQLGILLLANNMALTPFLVATIILPGDDPQQFFVTMTKILFMLVTLLAAQFYWLRGRKLLSAVCLGWQILLLTTSTATSSWWVACGMFLASVATLYYVLTHRVPAISRSGIGLPLLSNIFCFTAKLGNQALALQWRILLRTKGTALWVRVLTNYAISAFVIAIVILGEKQNAFPFMIIALGLHALVTSGCTTELLNAHRQAGGYTRSLPAHIYKQIFDDLAALILLHIFMAVPLALLFMAIDVGRALELAVGIAYSLGLVTVLHWVRLCAGRQGVLFSTVITVTWIVIILIS